MKIPWVFKLQHNIAEYNTDSSPPPHPPHFLKSVPLSTIYLLKFELLMFYELAFTTENDYSLTFTKPLPLKIHICPSDRRVKLYLA